MLTTDPNVEIVHRAIRAAEAAANCKDLDLLEEFVAPEARWHGTTGEIDGWEEFKKATAAAPGPTAFADTRVTIHDMLAEADKVTVRFTHSAMSVGPFWGHPAIHQQLAWDGIAIYRLKDGKIVETWTAEDLLTLFLQLGILKPPH